MKKFSNEKDLRTFLIQRRSKSQRSFAASLQSKEIQRAIIEWTSFLDVKAPINQRAWHFVENVKEVPVCANCLVENPQFDRWNCSGYRKFCSSKCSAQSQQTRGKFKATSIEKFGVDNIFKSEKFRDDLRKSMLEKHGVEFYFQSQECLQRTQETSLRKYGTNRPASSEIIRQKIQRTIKERYGVNHIFELPEIRAKKLMSERKLSPYFSGSYYFSPSGSKHHVQGYESRALDVLFKHFEDDDIVTSLREMNNIFGMIKYDLNGKHHFYVPDIYIKSLNKIIEVKSDYTASIDVKKQEAKKNAVIEHGIEFECWIF